MPTNKKEYMRKYMKEYVKKSTKIQCPICFGWHKTYNKYMHEKTKKHIQAIEK